MDDLVKRLRDYTCDCFNGNSKHMTWEAADRIDALEKALRRWVYYTCPNCDGTQCPPQPLVVCSIMRETLAALGEKKDG